MNFEMTNDQIIHSIDKMKDMISALTSLRIEAFNQERTVIVVVDMIKGFAVSGPLSSSRVYGITKPIASLIELMPSAKKVYLCDRHPANAAEFSAYLPHAIEGTEETMIVDELYALQDEHSSVIFKNSTNGMLSSAMKQYIDSHLSISDNFIVVGDCTDICILQFALSLKAYLNELNLSHVVTVPVNLVETYDLEVTNHPAELMNVFALYNMHMNGIRLVGDITK